MDLLQQVLAPVGVRLVGPRQPRQCRSMGRIERHCLFEPGARGVQFAQVFQSQRPAEMEPRIGGKLQGSIEHFHRLARPIQPRETFPQCVQEIDMARRLFAGPEQKRQGALIVARMHALQSRQAQQGGMAGAAGYRIVGKPHRLGEIGSP